MVLDTLVILYRYLVPILNTFAIQHQAGDLAPSGRQVRSRTVEDAVKLIGHAITAMEAPYPRLISQSELYIWLQFKYRRYSKQYPIQNMVKPTPLQVLRHISSISMASGDPLLMAESDMIIIAYLFLLHPSEYKGSKLESTNL